MSHAHGGPKKHTTSFIQRTGIVTAVLGIIVYSATSSAAFAQRIDDTVFENIVNQEVNKDSGVQKLNQNIEQKAQEVRDIEERLNIYKENLEKKQKERLDLQNQISQIEDRIESARQEIGKNEVEIEILELEVEVLKKQVTAAETDIERNKKILAEVMKQLYLRDQKSPFEIAMNHSTLSEFYSEAEYTHRIQQSMQETVDAVQQQKKSLEGRRDEMTQKKAEIASQTADLQTRQQTLEGEQEFKDVLLTQTKQSEEEFQKLVAQTKAERAQMEGEIAALQGNAQSQILKIREQIRARLNDGDPNNDEVSPGEQQILDGTSTFIWPIPSRLVTCGFHCPGYPFQNYIGPHSGMDIATSMGTPIQAAASGYVARVVFDPSSSRLGWIMIVHGDGLATVYMHTSGVNVQADQFVTQGQVIGRSGGMPGTPGAGTSTGPHLHFEVRLNGIPTNPANYLP